MPEQSRQIEGFKVEFASVLKSLLVIDAVLLLILTVGFVVPLQPFQGLATTGLPNDLYDDSAKISPFTPPEPEPARAKAAIVVITARGEHPTFVPPPERADDAPVGGARIDDDHDLRVVPAAVGANAQPQAKPAIVETVQGAHTS